MTDGTLSTAVSGWAVFSIVTPTFNRAAVLETALNAMLGMDGVEQCEIIVVDDGSTDATPVVLETLAARHPGIVRYTRQPNAGPGVARNTGLGLARLARILFLDDDVFPEPGLLRAHARFLDRGFDVSQGVLRWHPDLAGTWLMRFMDAHGMQFAFDRVENDEELSYLYVYTANLAVRAEKVREVGGFDNAFAAKRYAFEDTAFAYALKTAGCRLGLNREARAVHYHPMTPEGLAGREYKVGYAAGVLREQYPRIAAELGLVRPGAFSKAVTLGLGAALRLPVMRLLGNETRLRLACREAFGRGMMDYERHQART